MANERTTLVKSSIEPVQLTITVTATRINENGTFSGFKGMEISSKSHPKVEFKVSQPPQGGGSLYLKIGNEVTSLKAAGIKLVEGNAKAAAAPARKLF